MAASIPKVDPNELYQCLETHGSRAGIARVGTILRGSNPLVTASPVHWHRLGLADDEIRALHAERFGIPG